MNDQRKPRKGKVVERRSTRSGVSEPSVNMDELRELIALLRENGLAEFELEREGFRVRLRRDVDFSGAVTDVDTGTRQRPVVERAPEPTNNSPAHSTSAPPVASSPAHPGAHAESKASEDQDLQIIPSPIVGTFYRSASPTAEPFVKIGSRVAADSVVCIIEAMKLMNEIQAETSGEIAKIYVENGQPVEYGQPLFGIKR